MTKLPTNIFTQLKPRGPQLSDVRKYSAKDKAYNIVRRLEQPKLNKKSAQVLQSVTVGRVDENTGEWIYDEGYGPLPKNCHYDYDDELRLTKIIPMTPEEVSAARPKRRSKLHHAIVAAIRKEDRKKGIKQPRTLTAVKFPKKRKNQSTADTLTDTKTASAARQLRDMRTEIITYENPAIENHIWHPYAAAGSSVHNLHVTRAEGAYFYTNQNEKLLDGISSWWSVSYGHNNPRLVHRLQQQSTQLCHVMFAGLTHTPAQQLTESLRELMNGDFESYFYSDSGSVAVEVALKMALQYQASLGRTNRTKFVSLRHGYHGDTWQAMMVCDPDDSMHAFFGANNRNYFIAPPPALDPKVFNSETGVYTTTPLRTTQIKATKFYQEFTQLLEEQGDNLAAFILEPMLQGAGGMQMYDIRFLEAVIKLCQERDILVIFDEIATGFGRTGRDFAYQHLKSKYKPDIITLGKALTGGHITLGATASNRKVTQTLNNNPPHVFMHGPTFMANPLSTAVAFEAVQIYQEEYSFKLRNQPAPALQEMARAYRNLRTQLQATVAELDPELQLWHESRFLGPIMVLEFKTTVAVTATQEFFREQGIWVRPFGRILYLFLPYICTKEQIEQVTTATHEWLQHALQPEQREVYFGHYRQPEEGYV